ncbi:MAG: type II secretion system inner membrane protein GspF [Planctomycetota bacterium]|nr:type II secretion system inner membrane protein GspF [Planctomycetota bacterium]MDA0931827.1 type II secretion system inner membrane protein GspF [Planctomycetota bacterium]
MPIFEYKAVDGSNKQRKGIIDADSAREARLKLRGDRLYVTDIKEKKRGGGRRVQIKGVTGVEFPNKQRNDQVAQVTRQMASLLRAGIPLAETLRMVIEQAPDRKIEATFRDIREKVTQGVPLGDAVAQHPAYFSDLYANMVRAGESSGALDEVMVRLAGFLQAQSRLQNKVGAAMVYPMIMVVVGLVVVVILMTAVVPKVTQLLRAKNQELPLPTEILITVSTFLQNNWFLVFVGALLAVILFQLFVNSEKGRLAWDSFKLRVPVFGDLMRKQAVARFSTTFATLLRSGVPALQAIEVTKKVLDNVVLTNALTSVHDHVLEGTDISTPMKMTGAFPPMVCYMVGVGEQAGNLEEMLERVAETYDEEVDLSTQKLTSLIEPLIIVFLAVIVAGIVVAIVMPLLELQKVK